MTGQQAQRRNVDLGLRSARNDGAVLVAYNDVANAHRCATVAGTLDLRSANFDTLVAAKILLNRRNEPGRENVKLNRPASQPPPQPEERDQQNAADHTAAHSNAPDQASEFAEAC